MQRARARGARPALRAGRGRARAVAARARARRRRPRAGRRVAAPAARPAGRRRARGPAQRPGPRSSCPRATRRPGAAARGAAGRAGRRGLDDRPPRHRLGGDHRAHLPRARAASTPTSATAPTTASSSLALVAGGQAVTLLPELVRARRAPRRRRARDRRGLGAPHDLRRDPRRRRRAAVGPGAAGGRPRRRRRPVPCLTIGSAQVGVPRAGTTFPREGNMRHRWKALTAVCAVALAMSGSAALAHPPGDFGTPLSDPWGHELLVPRQLPDGGRTRPTPPTRTSPAPTSRSGTTSPTSATTAASASSTSRGRKPKLVSDMRCYGPQGDPSVIDTNRDGDADTLVLSVDSVLAGSQCGAAPGEQERDDRALSGRRLGGHPGLRRRRTRRRPKQIATVYQDCGSHTNTLLPTRAASRCTCSTRATRSARARPAARSARQQGRKVNHGVVQVVEIPFRDPAAARELTELPIVYPGDADGTYKPVSEHGIVAPLDDFLGCHDLSSFPAQGHRRRRVRRAGPGVGDRPPHRPARHRGPAVGLRPAERRLLALGDVQLGRQDRQLHRRVVRRRLPDEDDEDRRPARRPARRVRDREHVLLQRRGAASCCPSTATRAGRTTTSAPASGSRTARRTSASRCRRRTATCWSTRSTATARR